MKVVRIAFPTASAPLSIVAVPPLDIHSLIVVPLLVVDFDINFFFEFLFYNAEMAPF